MTRDPGSGLDPRIVEIAKAVRDAGGRAVVVGGFVRDRLLGARTKDVDVEVFGLGVERFEAILARFGTVHAVGRAFGVFRAAGIDADFSLPRRDSKRGPGHRGFDVAPDPSLDFAEAARRRDLTVNSMGLDPLTGEVLDPHGGRRDLERHVLRATDPAHFCEDPLRGLRVAQLAARLEMPPDDELVALCRSLDLDELSGERVFDELAKLLLRAAKPSIGFAVLEDTGLLRFFPELDALRGVPQDPEWHPEGDVWVHTLMVLDAAASLRAGAGTRDSEPDRMVCVAAPEAAAASLRAGAATREGDADRTVPVASPETAAPSARGGTAGKTGEAAPRTDEAGSAPLPDASLPGTSYPSQPRTSTRETTFGNLAQLQGSTRLKTSSEDLPLMLGALCHDLGKPATTQRVAGRVRSHRHDVGGVAPTRALLQRMRAPGALVDQVAALVEHHLAPALFVRNGATAKGYRRLARKLERSGVSIELLARVARADHLGRTTEDALAGRFDAGDAFLAAARACHVERAAPRDAVLGRHLIERGMRPGPGFAPILERCREIQDETGWTDPQRILDRALAQT